jgi:23S rRNA (cytidine1920-2'-O)/16S rRNA (cytidine1409-2'-O)-methyltransferase
LVSGAPADKASRLVAPSEPVVLLGPPRRFVSRGGDKLASALERFGVDVVGRRALDAGASTGGFTDCLLQNGAAEVVAVDVGHGQLDARLRADPRVRVLERTNVRTLTVGDLGGPPVDVVVADLSFISLTTVAPILAGPVARPGADLVVLVKPQFEAGRAEVSRGRGVVRDPDAWRGALEQVASALGAAGAAIMGAMASPLTGPAGNVEFLLHGVTASGPSPTDAVATLLSSAVDEATGTGTT